VTIGQAQMLCRREELDACARIFAPENWHAPRADVVNF